MKIPIAFPCDVTYIRKKTSCHHDTDIERSHCQMSPNWCTEEHTVRWYFFLANQTAEYADLISPDPAQFNWGSGPTRPSHHFRIYRNDPRIDVWYNEGLDRDTAYQLLVMDGMDPKRLHNSHHNIPKISFNPDEVKKKTLECPVCYEDVPSLIFARCCQMPVFCKTCGQNYDKCTLCHKELVTKHMLLKSPSEVINWLKEPLPKKTTNISKLLEKPSTSLENQRKPSTSLENQRKP